VCETGSHGRGRCGLPSGNGDRRVSDAGSGEWQAPMSIPPARPAPLAIDVQAIPCCLCT
jgi:hypothetical protein